ncbi:MAG: type I-E CRISPR-associated protein Cse1/CasA [Thermodesulfobacteriota bacterium]
MKFNLIDEQWIPVRRHDGTRDRIAPHEITKNFADNPVMALDTPRPDFNGALIQFLIGLVQTAAAPADEDDWEDLLAQQPTPEALQQKFLILRHAFELFGDGPRFMQPIEALIDAENLPIERLLIDAPKQNTLDLNKDHFVKRDAVSSMCLSCCATALFTAQTNSPAGGPGFRTSLRGGGPLTTLILGDSHFATLWHTIWLNILENKKFLTLCNSRLTTDSAKFPWLAPTKPQATEQDIHPAHYFWAMPRRIWLRQDSMVSGLCGICGREENNLITQYCELNKGTEYKPPMKHHLSPYDSSEKKRKALLTQPGGIYYRYWLGIVFRENGATKEPARIVHDYTENRQKPGWQFRVWSFGYDMDKAKARCWYEAKFPLITVEKQYIPAYQEAVFSIIKSADMICGNMKIAIKRVFHGNPEIDKMTRKIKWKYKDIKRLPSDEEKERDRVLKSVKEKSLFDVVEVRFWHETEEGYFRTLEGVKNALVSNSEYSGLRCEWHHILCRAALEQFDAIIFDGPFEDMEIKRVALARNELESINNSRKVREALRID